MSFIVLLITIISALIVDALFGDPAVSWHPVRIIGGLAAFAEKKTRAIFKHEKLAGAITWLFVVGTAFAFATVIRLSAYTISFWLGLITDILIIWMSIAPSDLHKHAIKVYHALAKDKDSAEPKLARQAVSMIVGRNVAMLDKSGVARACIESVAESSVDGVSAPLFWAIVLYPWFGPVFAFSYRAINTLDSIFGHKDDKYFHFGFVSARADDIANYIPARISSLIVCLTAPFVGGQIYKAFKCFILYRNKHDSPNAGQIEAAYAGALGVKLGGPVTYSEGLINKPWMLPNGIDSTAEHIKKALKIMHIQTVLTAALFVTANAAVLL